jgi:hypothetical protein
MTDKPRIENLELNKETLQELTEQESEQAEGGMRPRGCDTCNGSCDSVGGNSCNPPTGG